MPELFAGGQGRHVTIYAAWTRCRHLRYAHGRNVVTMTPIGARMPGVSTHTLRDPILP